ncbi:hypothetical protein MRX96_016192 [Rhipicephalus microplus]
METRKSVELGGCFCSEALERGLLHHRGTYTRVQKGLRLPARRVSEIYCGAPYYTILLATGLRASRRRKRQETGSNALPDTPALARNKVGRVNNARSGLGALSRASPAR